MTALAKIGRGRDHAIDRRASLRLWLRLLGCSSVIEKRIRRRFVDHGTTLPRFDVMAALDRHPDGLTMSALSRLLLVSNGNVTAVVRSLDRDSLIRLDRSPRDGRSTIVRLTEAGRDAFDTLSASHRRWIEAMLAGIEADQVDRLLALLDVVRQSIEGEGGEERDGS